VATMSNSFAFTAFIMASSPGPLVPALGATSAGVLVDLDEVETLINALRTSPTPPTRCDQRGQTRLFMGSGAAAGRQKPFVGASDIRRRQGLQSLGLLGIRSKVDIRGVILVPESCRRALQGRGPCTLRKRERTPSSALI
jgi:hypothetical protein